MTKSEILCLILSIMCGILLGIIITSEIAERPDRIETDGKKLYLEYGAATMIVAMPVDSSGAPAMYWREK